MKIGIKKIEIYVGTVTILIEKNVINTRSLKLITIKEHENC